MAGHTREAPESQGSQGPGPPRDPSPAGLGVPDFAFLTVPRCCCSGDHVLRPSVREGLHTVRGGSIISIIQTLPPVGDQRIHLPSVF